jgi:hypothetical protein
LLEAAERLTAGGHDLFTAAQMQEALAAAGVVCRKRTVAELVQLEVADPAGCLARARTGYYRLRGPDGVPDPVRPSRSGRRSAVEYVRAAVIDLDREGWVRVTRRDVEARLGEAGCPYSWRAVHGALRSLALTRPDLIGVGGHGWYRVGGPGTEDRSGRPVGGR